MESFYGGKRGQGFIIQDVFDAIYLNPADYDAWDESVEYMLGNMVSYNETIYRSTVNSGLVLRFLLNTQELEEPLLFYQSKREDRTLVDPIEEAAVYDYVIGKFLSILEQDGNIYQLSIPGRGIYFFKRETREESYIEDVTISNLNCVPSDNPNLWVEVRGMVQYFAKGREWITVNYNEYCLIETIHGMGQAENPTNGMIFRRLAYPDEPIVYPLPTFPPDTGDYTGYPAFVEWVKQPGAGAEFVGQIRGAKGPKGIHGDNIAEVGMNTECNVDEEGNLIKTEDLFNVYYKKEMFAADGTSTLSEPTYIGRINSIFAITEYNYDRLEDLGTIERETVYEIGDYVADDALTALDENLVLLCIQAGISDSLPIVWNDSMSIEGYKVDDGDVLWLVKTKEAISLTQMRVQFTDLDHPDHYINFRQLESLTTSKDGSMFAKFTSEPSPHYIGQLNMIEQIKRLGNHILIKYTDEYYRRHIPEVDIYAGDEQSTVWVDEEDGTRWLDCGMMIGGTRVKGLYSSLAELEAQFPHGFARKADGTWDNTRREDYGLLAHVEEIDAYGNYAIHTYAFDDNADTWYEVQLNINGGVAAALMWGRF